MAPGVLPDAFSVTTEWVGIPIFAMVWIVTLERVHLPLFQRMVNSCAASRPSPPDLLTVATPKFASLMLLNVISAIASALLHPSLEYAS